MLKIRNLLLFFVFVFIFFLPLNVHAASKQSVKFYFGQIYNYPKITQHSSSGSFSGSFNLSGSFTYNENGTINISGSYLESLSTSGWYPIFRNTSYSAKSDLNFVYVGSSSFTGYFFYNSELRQRNFYPISYRKTANSESLNSYTDSSSSNDSVFEFYEIIDFYRPDSGTYASSGSIVSNGNGTFSITGSQSGSFNFSSNDNDRSASFYAYNINFGQTLYAGKSYDVYISFNNPDYTLSVSPYLLISIDPISYAKCVISNSSCVIYPDTMVLNFTISPIESLTNFAFTSTFNVPDVISFNNTSGVITFEVNQLLINESIISRINNSLNSSSGANNQFNNNVSDLNNTFGQYQQATETDIYYANIDDSFFNFNSAPFIQVASTMSLYSTLLTSMLSSLGDFATPITLFLTIVVVGAIIGIARYSNSHGTSSNRRPPDDS